MLIICLDSGSASGLCVYGSKVMAISLNEWILPNGGIESVYGLCTACITAFFSTTTKIAHMKKRRTTKYMDTLLVLKKREKRRKSV